MSQQQLLSALVESLEAASVPYMLTGSTVSSHQGVPRSTHDIDVVVDLMYRAVDQLGAAFPEPDYYYDAQSVREAIRDGSMANFMHIPSGVKVDLWMLKDSPFDSSCFARRRQVDLDGVIAFVSSPEDTILQKLRWAAELGGSEKQSIDALRVYEVQRGTLDEAYLDQWAPRLGVTDALARIRLEAV